MNKNKQHSTNRFQDRTYLWGVLSYILLAIALMPFYQHQINPDGISYLSIAQKYLAGDFENAINGFWGPLYSILLIPSICCGIPAVTGAKIITLLIGLITVTEAYKFINKFAMDALFKQLSFYVSVLIILYYALDAITPDLLLVCLTFAYLNLLLRSNYSRNYYVGIKIGFLGALMYLTKAYGFPFFVIHFFVINYIFYLRYKKAEPRKRLLVNYISGMVIFTLVAVIWIFAISNKYDHFVLGNAGAYNHALTGPDGLGHPEGHPMFHEGFFPPPNQSAVSIWEDPSLLEMQEWTVFESKETLIHQSSTILYNMIDIVIIHEKFTILAILILLVALLLMYRERFDIVNSQLLILVFTAALLLSGYATLLVVNRYLWLNNILLLVSGAILLSRYLSSGRQISSVRRNVIILIFIASFIVLPFKNIISNLNGGKYLYEFAEELDKTEIHGKVVSNTAWNETLALAYYNDWKFYGIIGDQTNEELRVALDTCNIDFFILWPPYGDNIDFLQDYPEISNNVVDGMKVYKLR